jgi:hypothetical protein
MTITFLGAMASDELPAYIAGPVIDKASTVEIRFGTGEVLRLPRSAGRHRSGTCASMRRNCQHPFPCPNPVNASRISRSLGLPSPRSPASTAMGTSLPASPRGRPWTASHHSRTANNSGDIPERWPTLPSTPQRDLVR